MKFGIISIDDSRALYKEKIRTEMSGVEEISFNCVDARTDEFDAVRAVESHGLKFSDVWGTWSNGEIGGWLSHFNSWLAAAEQATPTVVFEDDAIIPNGFKSIVDDFVSDVPDDFDAIALCVPENQKPDYMWINEYNELGEPSIVGRWSKEENSQHYIGPGRVARMYQGYGHTAMMLSPTGAAKLVNLARNLGIVAPADCFILNMSHINKINGYSPKPQYAEAFAKFNVEEVSIIKGMSGV